MENKFYNPENIEAYLENKLSESERSFFENEIAKDPLLKNEITLQKDIINALKANRKAELKQRLSNIEVGMTSTGSSGAKIAASLLLSGLLSYGVYSLFNRDKEESTIAITESNNTLPSKTNDPKVKNNISTSESKDVLSTIPSNENSDVKNLEKNSLTKNKTKNKKQAATNREENTRFTPPQIVENLDNEQIQKDENTKLPDGKIAQSTETKSGIDVSIDASTDKKFHYKYHDNKLFLFGNFNSKTYEIIELNTYKGKQVYLYFDKQYYELKSNQLEISPLRKIKDAKVIEELGKFNK